MRHGPPLVLNTYEGKGSLVVTQDQWNRLLDGLIKKELTRTSTNRVASPSRGSSTDGMVQERREARPTA